MESTTPGGGATRLRPRSNLLALSQRVQVQETAGVLKRSFMVFTTGQRLQLLIKVLSTSPLRVVHQMVALRASIAIFITKSF